MGEKKFDLSDVEADLKDEKAKNDNGEEDGEIPDITDDAEEITEENEEKAA